MKKYLIIHTKDNVAVALQDLSKGTHFEELSSGLTVQDKVKAKHKFVLEDIKEGQEIFQYGVSVAKAKWDLPKGSLINTENVVHSTDGYCEWEPGHDWDKPNISKFEGRTFQGFHREDGQVGTSNNWLIIPLVFCENNNLLTLREVFNKELGFSDLSPYHAQVQELCDLYEQGLSADAILAQASSSSEIAAKANKTFPNVDGLKFLTHSLGCGGIQDDSETLCRLIAGYINHPNTAGATILSLGCQKAQISMVQNRLNELNSNLSKPVYFLEQQEIGTEKELINQAIQKTFVGLMKANEAQRSPAPLSELTIGVECGASDGFSGISANPVIGQVSDLITTLGGSAVLSEFPELCGVEQEMIRRCETKEISDQFVDLMRRYEDAAGSCGASMSANPSPGNIKDGLITDAIKSAGAAKKGGTSTIKDVQDYTGYINKKGLSLLCTPGNDVESTTALAGAGCNLILFSTGLGTPTGNPVTPVLKVSSNTILAEKMPDLIDYNSGTIIEGTKSLEEAGEELLELCIKVASGELQCKADERGQDDFIPWKRGVSL